MNSRSKLEQRYRLPDTARAFYIKDKELRLRKGIWNHTEVAVNFLNEGESFRQFFGRVASLLLSGKELDVRALILELKLSSQDGELFAEILESMRRQGFLMDATRNSLSDIVENLLGGAVAGVENFTSDPRPVMFVSDSDYSLSAARSISKEVKLPLDIIDQEVLRQLERLDLTVKSDAIKHLQEIERFKSYFSAYSCLVACFNEPRVVLLRNINRIAINLGKPFILGLVDGPFLIILCTTPPQTGCFECFENRALARLEDTLAYHSFVKAQQISGWSGNVGPSAILGDHMLTSAALAEAFLFSSAGICRLAGRCLNVYLPILEIHVEDLLRVPFCPACGSISKMEMAEMYGASERIMEKLLSRVEITT